MTGPAAPGRRILDRYELVRHVASGGMGTVWEAHDLVLDQTVALKQVGFAGLQAPAAEETRRRTLREARFAARLRGHHHVVSIYDVQELDGEVWLVLEYVPSRSLAALTDDGTTLPVAEIARIGAAVADALAAAHARGITHRDVKPGNVLLGDADGEVKLTDFGISHAEGEHPLTATGAVSGTPAYMAREVARGEDETSASDVFSLGATLYKAVEGRPPFGQEPNSLRMLWQVANGDITPPRHAGPLGPLLMQLLELDPQTRPDAAHARRLLDDFARRHRTPTDPSTTAVEAPPPGSPGAPAPGAETIPPGAGPPEADPEAPARSRVRDRVVAVSAAVVVLAAAVAGVVLVLDRTGPTAAAPLSEPVQPLAMTGDPKAADPCALLDPAAMGRFGAAEIGPGSGVGRCRLTNRTPAGSVYTEATYTTSAATDTTGATRSRQLGGVTVSNAGLSEYGCRAFLELGDATLVVIATTEATGTPPNLCEINDAAATVAVDRLVEDGITYSRGWQTDVALAGENACLLPGAVLDQVPGLMTGRRVSGSGGGQCFIGAYRQGSPYVRINLGMTEDADLSGYGSPGQAAGKPTYTRRADPLAGNPTACQVYLLHEPTYVPSEPREYISVTVEGRQPYEEVCRQASALAAAAEGNVSP